MGRVHIQFAILRSQSLKRNSLLVQVDGTNWSDVVTLQFDISCPNSVTWLELLWNKALAKIHDLYQGGINAEFFDEKQWPQHLMEVNSEINYTSQVPLRKQSVRMCKPAHKAT